MSDKSRISSFGEYRGFSEAVFDTYLRSSGYLALPEGTRLAYDLLLPASRGKPGTGPFPVLFKYTPYLRTFRVFDDRGRNVIEGLFKLGLSKRVGLRLRHALMGERGRFMDPVFRTPWLKAMLRHGYAVVVVERPGTGASFGAMDPSMETGGREAAQVIDWIEAQPWCDGGIGMFGDSFQAMVQFAAAAQGRKALKAIMPASSQINGYEAVMFPGGIYNKAFGGFFKWAVDFMESEVIAPIDGPEGQELLARARAERTATLGTRISAGTASFPFRDDAMRDGRPFWKGAGDLYPFIDRVNASGTAAYLSVGWYDIFTEDMFLWYENLKVPRRLVARPIDHSGADRSGPDLDYAAEALRWFDYWLKGIDNGIMDEAPIHYREMEGRGGGRWRESEAWPAPGTKELELFLAPSAAEPHGGALAAEAPRGAENCLERQVDYSATTGARSRWTAVNWKREYPDMGPNDAKGFAFTTEPLREDLVLRGEAVARIWISSGAPDLDLFVYLEEIDSRGRSSYVTEGELRLSHRRTSEPPYANFDLPFHSHHRSELEPLPPDLPVLAELAFLPTAYRFGKGKRLRLALTFADADNFETPVLEPRPRAKIHMNPLCPSSLCLPMIVS
jgi:putative CocE/NonD family hydrolase